MEEEPKPPAPANHTVATVRSSLRRSRRMRCRFQSHLISFSSTSVELPPTPRNTHTPLRTHATFSPAGKTIQIALPSPAATYTAHITHAILIALVAVLFARAGALPSVIPRGDAREEPS
jgi:hypothetical protein